MGELLADQFLETFDSAAQSFEDHRFEPLPETEWGKLQAFILEVREDVTDVPNPEDQTQVIAENKLLDYYLRIWVLTLSTAISAGFRPSEYFSSQFGIIERQLEKMGLQLKNIFPEEISSLDRTWLPPGLKEDINDWLEDNNKSREYQLGYREDPEHMFWAGCFNYYTDNIERAKELFQNALLRLTNKRMQFMALQKKAWCCARLGDWDEAINSYKEIRNSAILSDTKERAEGCMGYITALRNNGIEPE
ncbi:tol-pal system YbgF family protein [Chloroflexota bacterium]